MQKGCKVVKAESSTIKDAPKQVYNLFILFIIPKKYSYVKKLNIPP
jgi:hypothetical protein